MPKTATGKIQKAKLRGKPHRDVQRVALPLRALAERMGMTRGAISKLADQLAAKALIVRTAAKTIAGSKH